MITVTKGTDCLSATEKLWNESTIKFTRFSSWPLATATTIHILTFGHQVCHLHKILCILTNPKCHQGPQYFGSAPMSEETLMPLITLSTSFNPLTAILPKTPGLTPTERAVERFSISGNAIGEFDLSIESLV